MSILVIHEGKLWQLPAFDLKAFKNAKENYPESSVWIFGDEPKQVHLKELEAVEKKQ